MRKAIKFGRILLAAVILIVLIACSGGGGNGGGSSSASANDITWDQLTWDDGVNNKTRKWAN